MKRALLVPAAVGILLSLAGCGLAETGVSAATGAAAQAQQAKQARQTEQQIEQQINSAYQQDAARRKAAEAQAEAQPQ